MTKNKADRLLKLFLDVYESRRAKKRIENKVSKLFTGINKAGFQIENKDMGDIPNIIRVVIISSYMEGEKRCSINLENGKGSQVTPIFDSSSPDKAFKVEGWIGLLTVFRILMMLSGTKVIRQCRYCGKFFLPNSAKHKSCSGKCRGRKRRFNMTSEQKEQENKERREEYAISKK